VRSGEPSRARGLKAVIDMDPHRISCIDSTCSPFRETTPQTGGLRLIHVDHGLQAASADWARHWRTPARVPARAADHDEGEDRRARGESLEAAHGTRVYN